MTDLEACYFCGAVEEVERQSVQATGPTVALCPDCADRLDRVIAGLQDTDEASGATTIPVEPDSAAAGEAGADNDEAVVAGDEGPDDQGVAIETTEEPPDSSDGADDRPEGYGKVLRFLRNRELPVERETVIELAANAYNLQREQVGTALDHAVENGVLVEMDGDIKRA